MAQDRSRSAFDSRRPKHWSSVQAQQGRLFSDDDLNEADAIDKEDMRRTRIDVIGPDGSPDDGFLISNPRSGAGGIDFDLAPGTVYAGGLRATLEQSEAFALQRDWLQQLATDRPALGAQERNDLVYLEVWQQPVTSIEDLELQEVALGGADTSVRIRTMRRVRVLADVKTNRCDQAWKALGNLGPGNERPIDASLKVSYVKNTVPANLCSPSVQDGYLGAENQAIRVELRSANTVLWGFDNASPLYRVQATTDLNTGLPVIHFLQPPKDEEHWPLTNQVVELLPWSAVLPNGQKVGEISGGHLATVSASYDPDTQNIQITPSVAGTFGAAWTARSDAASLSAGGTDDNYLYLRVWNRGDDTTDALGKPLAAEIPFTAGAPISLGQTGVQITLTGTTFRAGDYWIIAARPQSPTQVTPWALETGLLAEGVRRYLAPLGLITWRPSTGAHTVEDCRNVFDPLTRRRGCCIEVSPQSGWEHKIEEVAAEADLCICFHPGDFVTTHTITLTNKNISIHGAGAATRINGTGLETVLLFDGCSNVAIRDLTVRSTAQVQQGKAAPKPHLAGAISVRNCDRIDIQGVVVRSASGPIRSTSCISLYNDFAADRVRASSARVAACELIVGANQNGLSILNFGRSVIENNDLHVDTVENAQLPANWLQIKEYRRVFRRALLRRYGMGDPPQAVKRPVKATIRDTQIWFETDPALAQDWTKALALRRFSANNVVHKTVGEYLNEIAGDIVFTAGSLGTSQGPRKLVAFEQFFSTTLKLRTATTGVRTIAAQGIVVAGTASAKEVRILGNTIRDFTQGVHIGISHSGPRLPTVTDTAGRIVISNNSIYVTLMPESVVERHGIFVGNCQSLLIEGNKLECERLGNADGLAIDGIRIYGVVGRMAYVTRNHVTSFTTAIRFAAINNKVDGGGSMWRVTENLREGAGKTVDPALKIGTTTFLLSVGNMP